MEHQEQVRILTELLRQIEDGVNVDAGAQVKNPTETYRSAAQAEREWHDFFQGYPQLLGLSGDLPEPGSYLTADDFGMPVLATRGADGVFRAFLNACRHRGTQLAVARRGQAKRFVCPFHGWSYTAEGALHGVTQPHDFGEVDYACSGLIELPALERDGLLWVHPQPEGTIEPAELLGGLAAEIGEWHAGDRIFCGEKLIDKALNWKLANDTFGETYHFSRLHRNTLGKIFHSDALCYDTFGRNHRFIFPSRNISSLRRKPESDWRVENVATILYYLFPNVQITMSDRQITLIRIYPVPGNPGRSRTRVSHYFSRQALSQIDAGQKTVIAAADVYNPKARDGNAIISPDAAMEVTNSTIENEDYAMGESTQRSIDSGLLDHLVFGRNEPALHHFHNTFRKALGMSPLERL